MDAFDYAKRMELDGIRLYEEELNRTKNPGLKTILNMLIQQEKKHYDLFDFMSKSTDVDMTKASFKGIKNIFDEIKDKGEVFPKEELDFYDKILKIEEDSETFYRKMAQDIEDENVKAQILQIADEEHKHFIIINNLIMMVNRPNSWVEDAEFNHLEDY